MNQYLIRLLLILILLPAFIQKANAQGCAKMLAGAPALCAIGGGSLAGGAAVGATAGMMANGAMGISGAASAMTGLTAAGAMANFTAMQACTAAMEKCRASCALEGSEPAMAECTAVYTPLIATLKTQAIAFGIGAGASLAVGAASKSSSDGGGGGGGGTPLNGGTGAINGQVNNETNPTTNEGQSSQSQNSVNCVISGGCQSQQIVVNTQQSADPTLGDCANDGAANLATCYDKLNDYCGGLSSAIAAENSICKNFCKAKANADSCTRSVGSTNKPSPILPTATSSPQTTATTNSGSLSVTKLAAASNPNKGTCADTTEMHKPSCFNAMKQYCGQYGKSGTGCSTFCSYYPKLNGCSSTN